MSVKRRLNLPSGGRLDSTHVRSIESAVSYDFDSTLRGLVTGITKPYLIRGFKIKIPAGQGPATSLEMEVSNSAVLHSTATESGTILTVPSGTANDILDANSSKIIGSFQNGVANYVSLDYRREIDPNTVDAISSWSPSQKLEFQRTAPIGKILQYKYIISPIGFSTYLPLYIVYTNLNGEVTKIVKAGQNLFRLGSGGANPDPTNSFNWGNLNNTQTLDGRREWVSPVLGDNPLSVVPGNDQSAFEYGDFSITSLKDWMDAIMTRFKEISGSNYWYTNSSLSTSPTVNSVWFDSVGSVLTGSGSISYNLILESTTPSSGLFQSYVTDPSILPGDTYVEGATSGVKATATSFNINSILINSLTSAGFLALEPLYFRRDFRPNAGLWKLVDYDAGGVRRGTLQRAPDSGVLTNNISSWSYTNLTNYTEIQITTTAPHGFDPGEFVRVSGISTTSSSDVVGVHRIMSVPALNVLVFYVNIPQSGITSVSGSNGVESTSQDRHPFTRPLEITSFTCVGTTWTLVVPGHNYSVGDELLITGLTATGKSPWELDGLKTIGLDINNNITFTDIAVTGTGVSNAKAETFFFITKTTVTGAFPEAYNTTNETIYCIAGDKAWYQVGSSSLPQLFAAGGPISFDTIVAESTVADPVKITSIVNNLDGSLTVTTGTAHGLLAATSTSLTIHGDTNNSPYIRSYESVDITGVSTFQFTIVSTLIDIPTGANYTNPGSHKTFLNFTDNPYAGPIQWTGDMVVKSVIGDLSITIPSTALVDISDPNVSIEANKFNTNGVTGTAYLEDGEVAFVRLERNQSVSAGVSFNTVGGSATISGNFLDTSNNLLVPGDFVKFAGEPDSHWLKISSITPTSMVLVSNNGQPPSSVQRPPATGPMIYTKGVYSNVYVTKHYLVDNSSDIYWFGLRKDNGGSAKVYFRSLEIEPGEVRQVNDNQGTNHLIYTGAMNEAAINPNYTKADLTGDYVYKSTNTISALDLNTKMITFSNSANLGFQKGDKLKTAGGLNFTIKFPLSSRTVIVSQDISGLSIGNNLDYFQVNQNIDDQDNLTLAHRKQDRTVGAIDTALKRPVYDESVYIQQINLGGSGTIRSGSYIYKGTQQNPTALAWVLHGNVAVSETIESVSVTMPGGHSTIGSNAILVNIVYGTFSHSDSILQLGGSTGRTVNNSGNPPFTAPSVDGTGATGVELVLPPNKRTQVYSSGSFDTYGAHSIYKASSDVNLAGEELLVMVNDGVREVNYDYAETYGGPKAKIQLKRTLPPNTRMRFRCLSSFGSVLAAKAADTTLQSAYNSGATIVTAPSRPVEITSANVNAGEAALVNRGSILINGGATQLGGIFNESGDQGFVIGREDNKPKESWTGVDLVKTHSSHPGSALARKTAGQVVVGASATLITGSEITLADNTSARIKISAVARRSDGTFGTASFAVEGTFYRSGGTAAAAGSPIANILGFDGDGVNYAITFALSGNDVVAVVYGSSGATVQWVISLEYQLVGVA